MTLQLIVFSSIFSMVFSGVLYGLVIAAFTRREADPFAETNQTSENE